MSSISMRIGINLRGDLAKLDDAEIASRYEALISETETKHRAKWPHASGRVIYRIWKSAMGRGLLHSRLFYKIHAFLFGTLVAIVGQSVITPSDLDLYFLNCELKDVRDEIERRVQYRKTPAVTS